jgi:MFS family permease
MFAFLSSAWTIPSLIGPLFGGLVASWADWRVVFWALAPTMPLLLPLVLPTVRRLPPAIPEPLGRASSHPVLSSVLLAAGAGVFLIGLESTRAVVVVGLGAIGIATAIAALRRITPAGTLRAARGAPAGIAVRFLLCSVYFGSEAFLPLGLTSIHGLSATSAGIGLAAGALSWTAGSFLQARLDGRFPGKRAYAITLGFATLLAGEVVMGLAVALPGLWSGWAVIGWALGGAGMGVAFNAATSATMAVTPAASTGNISAALQLAQTLATALIAGFGGALIARTGATTTGFLLVFGLTAALGLIGVLLSHRSAAVAERR